MDPTQYLTPCWSCYVSRRKNRPSEEAPTTAAGEMTAAASCASTVVDRSGDSDILDVVSPTSVVELERIWAPTSYDEQTVDLHSLDETCPLTDDGNEDVDDDGATADVWIEKTTTSRSPPSSSPSSIVWRSREFRDRGPQIAASADRRRISEGAAGSRSRWLPPMRSPGVEVRRSTVQPELVDPTASRGDVSGGRASRLPNGIVPGTRSSSPPGYQSVRSHLQPTLTLARPRSESNFSAVTQRSNVVGRLRSLPCRSPGEDATAARKRRRRTVDLAPAVAASPHVLSAEELNRSKLGRVTKEELYRMWKASERALNAQLRVAMQQKAELQQRLQAAELSSAAERLTVT